MLTSIFSVQTISLFASVIFVNRLIKYKDSQKVYQYSIILKLSGILAFSVLCYVLKYTDFFTITIIGFCLGAGDAFFLVSNQLVFKKIVRLDLQEERLSLVNLSKQAVNVLIPQLFIMLIAIKRINLVLISITIILLFSKIFIAKVRGKFVRKTNLIVQRNSQSGTGNEKFINDFLQVKAFFKNHNWLLMCMLVVFVFSPIQQALSNIAIPTYILSIGTEKNYTTILSLYSIGSLVGSLIFLKFYKYFKSIKSIMSILLIGVASYSAIVSTKLFLIIYLLSFFVGIFVQLFLISWENKVLKEIPEKYLTMVSSFNWIVLSSLNPIALTIVGNFSEIYGTRITVTFSMVFVSILIMMTLIINFINQNSN
ncbi:hypothetical protein E3V19_04315 [Streptococcus pseudopneumoniae]|nr:MFS transporter [Streptococcus pseudopneumoniae]TMR87041.1 hypothetical protein E3V19_04315 [Streptococcus pseudopneumoniae]